MNALEELAELLPTKAARWVALATPPVAGLAFAAPHFLSPLLPASTQAEIVLAQILLLLLVALIGSLTILYLVLRAHHENLVVKPRKKISLPQPPVGKQESIRELILSILFNFPEQPAHVLAKVLEKPIELLNYHLEELKKLGLLDVAYLRRGTEWSNTQAGREYVIQNNLMELPEGVPAVF